eukprot:2134725-Prymnesium_polylepis.2
MAMRPVAGARAHVPAHVPTLHGIATQCLEERRRRRPEVADLVGRIEEIRTATSALRPDVPPQFVCKGRSRVPLSRA